MKDTIFSFNEIFSKTIDFYKNFFNPLYHMALKGGLFFLILKLMSVSYVEVTSFLTLVCKLPHRIPISLDPTLIQQSLEASNLNFSTEGVQLSLIVLVYFGVRILAFILMPWALFHYFMALGGLLKQISIFVNHENTDSKDRQIFLRKSRYPFIGALFVHLLLTIPGFFLFFFPGLFCFIRFFYVYVFIFLEGQTLKQALKSTWDLTKGGFFQILIFLTMHVMIFFIFLIPFYLGMAFLDIHAILRHCVYFLVFSFLIPIFLISYYFLFLQIKKSKINFT